MQVERGYTEGLPEVYPSGGRVSNAWVTYLIQGDNTGKPVLIPHNITGRHRPVIKGEIRYEMGPRPIS